jgi:hypothetical protein
MTATKIKPTTVATDLVGREVRITWGMNDKDIMAELKRSGKIKADLTRHFPFPYLNRIGTIRAVYLNKDKEPKAVVEVGEDFYEFFLVKDLKPSGTI